MEAVTRIANSRNDDARSQCASFCDLPHSATLACVQLYCGKNVTASCDVIEGIPPRSS
jgi:hypothetical protein